jgi:hypothetical protein
VSEYDAIDAMIERAAREEQEELNRQHGQFLLDVMDARMQQGSGEHPALEVLRRAHEAKVSEAGADKQ